MTIRRGAVANTLLRSLTSAIGAKVEQPPSVSEAEPQIFEESQNITERIRERAYELYQLRGQSDGHDLMIGY